MEEPEPEPAREGRLTDFILRKPVGLFMRLDFEAVAAREVKKELTPSYESNCSRKNAVYDDINQRGACDGEYGECEFGIETRKQSREGKMGLQPRFPVLPSPCAVFPRGGREEGNTPSGVGPGRVVPKFTRGSLEGQGIHVNKQLGRFMGKSSIL